MPLSLYEFGRLVECNYTTASRLLSGDRSPSTRLLARICKAYGLDGTRALAAMEADQGREDGRTPTFAAFLKAEVFDKAPPGDDVTHVTQEAV